MIHLLIYHLPYLLGCKLSNRRVGFFFFFPVLATSISSGPRVGPQYTLANEMTKDSLRATPRAEPVAHTAAGVQPQSPRVTVGIGLQRGAIAPFGR